MPIIVTPSAEDVIVLLEPPIIVLNKEVLWIEFLYPPKIELLPATPEDPETIFSLPPKILECNPSST